MKSFKTTIFFGDSWNRRESETFTNARPLRGAGALFLSMFCSLHCHVSGCCSVAWVKSLSCWILPSSWLCWRAATCALPSFCWMCLDLFGGSWKAADFLESLFACRNIECLFFWYSFCSVLIGSAWFRSCWQEKPHVDCCNSEFCVVSRLTCVLTVATSTPVIRFDPIGFPWISKRTRKRKGA